MKAPPAVSAVLDKPGMYAFYNPTLVFLFEVDERGRVHQLTPRTLQRDGILNKTGWNATAQRGTVKPIGGKPE